MYCGDETGAFIGDVGSSVSRFGYGGEDNPKFVVPSFMGATDGEYHTLTSSYNCHYDKVVPLYRLPSEKLLDPNTFLQQDSIEYWDACESMWESSMNVLRVRDKCKHTTGGSSPRGKVSSSAVSNTEHNANDALVHPILAISPGHTHKFAPDTSTLYQSTLHRKELQQYSELLLETLGAPACFVAPSPMLASFCYGRQTSLVVDIGASGTRVTPVVDGLLLKHAQRRSGRGGDWLGHVTKHVMEHMLKPNKQLVTRYQLKGHAGSSSCPVRKQWAELDLMYEFRTSPEVTLDEWRVDNTMPFSLMSSDNLMDIERKESSSDQVFELPDGTMIDLANTATGRDLKHLPELYFSEQTPFEEDFFVPELETFSDMPLPQLIKASLTAVGDADARKELCSNICLAGSGSLVPNLEKRLSYELTQIVPSVHKCRVVASRFSAERSFAAWIGGSILTSLGSFQQLWLSKTEYEEYGSTLAVTRFP